MRKIGLVILVLACFGILSAGAAPDCRAASSEAKTIMVKNSTTLGEYLTDSKGMTLYYFKKDSPGKSACSGPCVEKWPLFYVEKITTSKEAKSKDFGEIKREDGKEQNTFKGYPLYYFVNDKNPGDTNGQGLGDVWFVVNPAKFKP